MMYSTSVKVSKRILYSTHRVSVPKYDALSKPETGCLCGLGRCSE